MTKLSDLALTPEMMAERQARERQRRERIAEIAARVEPSRKAQSPSRADLHALLDACLDLAEMREPEKWPAALWSRDDDAVKAARPIGRALARGAFGWTEPETTRAVRHVNGRMTWSELEHAPVQWREEMAGRLERSPHVLPARMVRALADALRWLSDGSGDTPWLLAPNREPGRGSNPQEARRMEEEAWCWIFRRKGAGERIGVATSKVADAVGRTPDAVKKWREEWEKRDGKESVKCRLEGQKEIGASGEPPPETLLDLPEIARRWQAAVDPRRAEEG